ncbi:MAG TPA: helix-turn-helix domain-containing protein [Sedimentisphaerales bacterium]|nr:helix-turn-helix domain-containing protein [Phycisphaerae bacterium]HON90693.1 helix-turn-helix domain-containing protein [Sedimentisphaerales bacterium]HQG49193.1 helix-turn-helix domain-containing protein [Sedimentisphaerales bacterium]
MAKGRNVLTTGDVAKICNVAPRTVSKWFDSGQLKGYRIPGSKDRRIPLNELIRFMKANNMPTEALAAGKLRVLVLDSDPGSSMGLQEALRIRGGYEVLVARNGFEAGVAAQKFVPHVVLINLLNNGIDAHSICTSMRNNEDLATIKIVALANHLGSHEAAALLHKGFDGYVSNPSDPGEVIRKIEETTAIIY